MTSGKSMNNPVETVKKTMGQGTALVLGTWRPFSRHHHLEHWSMCHWPQDKPAREPSDRELSLHFAPGPRLGAKDRVACQMSGTEANVSCGLLFVVSRSTRSSSRYHLTILLLIRLLGPYATFNTPALIFLTMPHTLRPHAKLVSSLEETRKKRKQESH